MNQLLIDLKHEKLKDKTSSQFRDKLTTLNQLRRLQMHLQSNANSLNHNLKSYKTNNWLFKLKIKHQILLLTIVLIMIVAGMSSAIKQIHFQIFAELLVNGFNQILQQQNKNFQASIMIKYMSLTKRYFYNDQQMLLAINQIYNHALKSQYSIDKGVQCALFREDGQYLSYQNFDLFCYCPYGQTDLVNYPNTTQNTEFVKFTNILSQFVLSFQFHLSYQINNYIQITLDDQEEMVSVYPQSRALIGYSPRLRPFFVFQKEQYNAHKSMDFYVSKYLKWYGVVGGTLYGQTLTVNLLNGTKFQGVIAVSIQFNVFDKIFQNFPDVNLALVADDGTLLYEQTQFQIYNQQDYIYNQSQTGYNYEDWIILSSHKDYTKQLIMNNSLFPDPINVNIKKFNDLPYYFIVYNNLTYEKQIKTIQQDILVTINNKFYAALYVFISILTIILILCYFHIERILKPITMINRLIYCHNEVFKNFQYIRPSEQSKNILGLLLLVIYFKYSELKNLSFRKSQQCLIIEELQFPYKQSLKLEQNLVQYLRVQQELINSEEKLDIELYESSFTFC